MSGSQSGLACSGVVVCAWAALNPAAARARRATTRVAVRRPAVSRPRARSRRRAVAVAARQHHPMARRLTLVVMLFVGAQPAAPLQAQRTAVLQQVDLPHPYYWREMYVPQVTSGPSAVTWSP